MENLYITGQLPLKEHVLLMLMRLRILFLASLNHLQSSDELVITVSGSQVPNRGPNDWLADYFGLSTTYQSNFFLNHA